MVKYFMLAAALFVSFLGLSQKLPLVNSGQVLESGKISYDSGNYQVAIKKFLTIHERDTNYISALAELGITYLAAKEYDKAIEVCDKGLTKPSENRAHLLRTKAIVLDKKGDYAKSLELFEKTVSEYPMDPILHYNYGITLFNAKEYAKSKEQFFHTLSINPFHAGSHRALSRMAMLEGRKTYGMMAMGIYLSINPDDNEHLVMINNFVLNQITDENSITSSGANAFEKLDQIIRAKMAMDKNFTSKFSFDYAIVKQFEMLFEQLGTGTDAADPYNTFYTPLFKKFKEKGYIEPFIYNLIKSTGNEQAKKWMRKNEKVLKEFYDGAGSEIRTKRNHPVIPASYALGNDYTGWYNDSGRLTSVGKKTADDKMVGKYYFFHYNMERSAEGSFNDKEEKVGVWKYYSKDGTHVKTENHDTGEMTFYHPNGNVYQHFFLVKDSIEGPAEVMYRCGATKEKYTYKENKRNGKAFTYFPDGKTQSEFNYKLGKLDGESKYFYENGKIESVMFYKDGMAEGSYKKYFPNGKPEIVGQYVNDDREGEWKYFYFNGAVDRAGKYSKGLGVGEWLFFNEHGEMVEKRNFDAKGKLQGENTFYVNGKTHYVRTMKDEIATKFVFVSESGSEIAKTEKASGDFALKSYFPTGQVNGEGNMKGGKNQGVWKFHFRYGGLKSEYTYKDDLLHGPATEYYPGGGKKSTMNYENDELHGYYQSFHLNGKVSEEGWYQNGKRQQQWITYGLDGKIEDENYYLNGELTHSDEFSADGKLVMAHDYDDEGNVEALRFFAPDGKNVGILKDNGKKKIYETTFQNKKPQFHMETLCGMYYGAYTRWFPDGKPFYSYTFVNGKRDGKFQYYDIRNQLEREGNYVDGWAEGIWKGYENGKLDYIGRYFNNKFDSVWTYFGADGKESSRSSYLRGERHGLSSTANAEGGPALEKLYENDDLVAYRTIRGDGTWSEWQKFNGNAVITTYYNNGAKASEEEYKNGRLTGVRRNFFSNGKIYSEYNFINGDYEGPFIVNYPNGKVREKGEYKFDELHGKVEWFNEDGSLYKSETNNYGVRAGKAVVYQKGVKSKEVTFWGNDVYE
jgi:uncharacterized protein